MEQQRDIYDWIMLFVNSFAAIGTMWAALIALYIIRKDRAKLTIFATKSIITEYDKSTFDIVEVTIANGQPVPINVRRIYWRLKFLKGRGYQGSPQYLHHYGGSIENPPLPHKLQQGDFIEIKVEAEDFKMLALYLTGKMDWFKKIIVPYLLIIGVETPQGITFEAKPNKNVRPLVRSIFNDLYPFVKLFRTKKPKVESNQVSESNLN